MPKLTKRVVDAAKVDHSHEIWIPDSTLPGFGLRVLPTEVKTYAIRYRTRNGRSRRMNIGPTTMYTPDEARGIAREHLGTARAGGDPAAAKRRDRSIPTVKDLCALFDRERITPDLKEKTARRYRHLIEKRINKRFGNVSVAEVTQDDVFDWHASMKDTPVEANRALTLLHTVFETREGIKWRNGPNPALGVKKFPEKACDRYLDRNEFYRIFKAIDTLESDGSLWPPLALGFRLLLFTGLRRDEMLQLRWDQIDWDDPFIHLTDAKEGDADIPLSPEALSLLGGAPRIEGSPWVVTSKRRRDGQWSYVVNPTDAWKAVRETAGLHEDGEPDVDVSDVTLHTVRHSLASMGRHAGLTLDDIGPLLGHRDPGSTARYAHLWVEDNHRNAELVGKHIHAAMNGVEGSKEVSGKTASGEG